MEETKQEEQVAPKKKTKKELEAEKAAEEKALAEAAEAQRIEDEKATLRDKLVNRKIVEHQRAWAKSTREITDRVKDLSGAEGIEILNLNKSSNDKLAELQREYDKAVEALKREREKSAREIKKACDDAVAEVRARYRDQYAAHEKEMIEGQEKAATALQGFKDRLESASLEDLQKLWDEKSHDAKRPAKARA